LFITFRITKENENWNYINGLQVKLLFAAERQLCNKIFEGVDSLKDECFAEVTSNSLSVLMSFGEAVAKSKRSPEKLFVLLDMYEIMRELQPDVCSLFYNISICSLSC
jgi:exocyst complex component 7